MYILTLSFKSNKNKKIKNNKLITITSDSESIGSDLQSNEISETPNFDSSEDDLRCYEILENPNLDSSEDDLRCKETFINPWNKDHKKSPTPKKRNKRSI